MYDSLRISLGLPVGTPEGLVYALVAKKESEIVGIVDSRQSVIREKIRVAPGNSTGELLEKCGFQYKNGIYPDFQNKSIMDLGGGFGGIAPKLALSADHIVVVDPVFNPANNLTELCREDESRILERIGLRKKFLQKNPHLVHINDEISEAYKVYQEVLWWNNTYNPAQKHKHIQRNPSYGEHIIGIGDNSQDFVFVNYVLLKDGVHFREFIQEINRVLKIGGCLIISDYKYNDDVEIKRLNSLIEYLKLFFEFNNLSFIQNGQGRIVLKVYK